jgi:hypothetical protein
MLNNFVIGIKYIESTILRGEALRRIGVCEDVAADDDDDGINKT